MAVSIDEMIRMADEETQSAPLSIDEMIRMADEEASQEETAPEQPVETEAPVETPEFEPPTEPPGTVPTTVQDLYYNPEDPVAKSMSAKEQAAKDILRMKGVPASPVEEKTVPFWLNPLLAASGTTYKTVSGPTPEQIEKATKDLAEVQAYKDSIYGNIQGENITDVGIGKIVKNPDGTSQFVPGPYSTEFSQTVLKSVLDTARGLLAIPEWVSGQENMQLEEIVPEVAVSAPSAAAISEVVQLTAGSLFGLGTAAKLKKYTDIVSNNKLVKAFFEGTDEVAESLLTNRGKKVVESVVKTGQKVIPKGTVSGGLGAAAVADDDVATLFFGEPGATVGEVKTAVLKDALLFGGIFGTTIEGGKAIGKKVPSIAVGYNLVKNGIVGLFGAVNPGSAEERVIERLGELYFENSKRLANAKTPEEVIEINLENWEALKKTYSEVNDGRSLDDLLAGLDEAKAGDATVPEVIGDSSLIRLYEALRATKGAKEADAMLRERLGAAEFARMEELVKRTSRVREELAPEGLGAGEKVKTQIGRRVEKEMEELRTGRETSVAEARQEAQEQVSEVEARRLAQIEQVEEGVQQAVRTEQQTAQKLAQEIDNSPISKRNMEDLNNQIADDGAATPISNVLEADIATKNALGDAKTAALTGIGIPEDEALSIVQDLLTAYSSRSLVRTAEDAQQAGRELSYFIRQFTSESAGAASVATGTPKDIARLKELLDILDAGDVDPVTLGKYATEIKDLTSRGVKVPKEGAVTDITEEAVGELPALTANDLSEIITATRARASELGRQSVLAKVGKQQLSNQSKGLKAYADTLQQRLDGLLDDAPEAKAAVKEFDDFFANFRETWRNETGRDWQVSIIGSNTIVDAAETTSKILKIFTNPKATPKDIALISNMLSKMPADTRASFIGSMGNRILGDFVSKNGIILDELAGNTVGSAATALNRVDKYLVDNAGFENVMPGVFNRIRQIQTDLRAVVSPAQTAKDVASKAQKAQAKKIRDIESEAKLETKKLTSAEQDAVNSINLQFQDAMEEFKNTALIAITKNDTPGEYIKKMLKDSQNGFTNYKTLWDKAAQIGPKGPNGLTKTQDALQESAIFGLLDEVQPVIREQLEQFPSALQTFVKGMQEELSVTGKILNLGFKSNPDARTVLSNLERSLLGYRKLKGTASRDAVGSPTFEKTQLPTLINDIAMVKYGPLTQDFRMARFVNKILFFAFDSDRAVANAFANVLTDARYSKRILDKAAEIAMKKMVPEEEAFNTALLYGLMASRGINKYFEADDPDAEFMRDFKNQAVIEQTEEGLGASPSQ